MSPSPKTILSLHAGYQAKKFSCVEVVEAYLKKIDQQNDSIGAFLRARESAVAEAKAVDARIKKGETLRPLEGVPIAIKDNLLIKGETTTAASKILENYTAPYSATAVQKVLQAGAVVLGKTNMDEFAMGTSTENSAFGETRNPWNTDYVPGGSSGGSAAAVAAGQTLVALGSDTGGSIRQPAAFCGVVGFKPTYGRVSRYGLMALASSLDQIGPLSTTVEDAARVYQAILGQDPCDMTSSTKESVDVVEQLNDSIKGLKIGLPKEFFDDGVDPKVRSIVQQAVKEFEKLGATVSDVSLPHAVNALATYYILQPAEASSNLARYDGIRYGLSVRDGNRLEEMYDHSRAQGFGTETKRRIMMGTFVLSAGYADAYYHQANRVRSALREEMHKIYDSVDLMLTPTTPTPPFKIGENVQDPLKMYLADLFTVPANLAGTPAISIPAGWAGELPVGLQLMAKAWDEATLLRAAAAYQQVTDWHTRTPASS